MTNAREFFGETILQPQSSPGCCSPKGVISGYPGKSKNKASTYESSHQESINPQLLLSPRDCLSPRGLSKMQQYSMDLSLNYSQSNLVYISCIHNPLWQGIQCLSLHVQNHLHLFVLKQHWFNSPQTVIHVSRAHFADYCLCEYGNANGCLFSSCCVR